LWRRHDPELLAGVVDDPDLADPDALVDANAVITSGRTIECDNASWTGRVEPTLLTA
jgi:hypothetical protein